jgi:hypothetical protein
MRWIVGVGPLGRRRVRIAVPGVFTVWLRPTATANCNDASFNDNGNLISEAKRTQFHVMNASGGMHRKFGRREPIVFKRPSIPPRTAGRWPRSMRTGCRKPPSNAGRPSGPRVTGRERGRGNPTCRADQRSPSAAGSRVGPSGPWPSLRQTMAAVGHHHRPGHERGRLVGEKEHARGDLRRRATAPDRSRRRGGGFER